ncbi:hypothetical protein KC19_5G143000 [Ceratodon purpureus]|uniref:Uncharacterized protein n=1 Tax=Ceratodon purpureus TaxID=3225 RepID=A0A8T0I394_CERPU|nr:hypothetical protein KC19_5G143000 [Ceratodon purpureus]
MGLCLARSIQRVRAGAHSAMSFSRILWLTGICFYMRISPARSLHWSSPLMIMWMPGRLEYTRRPVMRSVIGSLYHVIHLKNSRASPLLFRIWLLLKP